MYQLGWHFSFNTYAEFISAATESLSIQALFLILQRLIEESFLKQKNLQLYVCLRCSWKGPFTMISITITCYKGKLLKPFMCCFLLYLTFISNFKCSAEKSIGHILFLSCSYIETGQRKGRQGLQYISFNLCIEMGGLFPAHGSFGYFQS